MPAFVFGLYEVLNGNHRILGGLISLLTTVGIVVSGTRGAWVACVVTVVLFIVPRLTLRGRIAALATVLVLLVAAYQIPGVADLVAERTGNALSSGGAGRTDIWSVAGTVYQSHPVLGVGYANFPVAYTADVIRASGVGRLDFLRRPRGRTIWWWGRSSSSARSASCSSRSSSVPLSSGAAGGPTPHQSRLRWHRSSRWRCSWTSSPTASRYGS